MFTLIVVQICGILITLIFCILIYYSHNYKILYITMLCVGQLLCTDYIEATVSTEFIYPFEHIMVFMLIFYMYSNEWSKCHF